MGRIIDADKAIDALKQSIKAIQEVNEKNEDPYAELHIRLTVQTIETFIKFLEEKAKEKE